MDDTETADRRTEILNAVTRVLTSRGLQALSFEAVASEAGLSRQLVRYYYPTLDELMVALCDQYSVVYRDILTSGVVDAGSVERLEFFLDFFFGLSKLRDLPDHLEAYDALVAYSVGSKPLRDRLCDQYRTLGQVMIHELAIAHPDLSNTACEELSYIFVSMMHTHWSFVASLGHTPDHGRLAREAFDRVVDAYRAGGGCAGTDSQTLGAGHHKRRLSPKRRALRPKKSFFEAKNY